MSSRSVGLPRALRAGFVYFAFVFACGFALGTVRVVLVAPAVGELGAVLIEAPVILAVSWFVCRVLIARLPRSPGFADRAAMGAFAFLCLISAEVVLTVTAFGGGVTDVITGWTSPAGAVGLAGQIAFGVFPVFVRGGERAQG